MQIAAKLGISQALVSRALSGRAGEIGALQETITKIILTSYISVVSYGIFGPNAPSASMTPHSFHLKKIRNPLCRETTQAHARAFRLESDGAAHWRMLDWLQAAGLFHFAAFY